MKTENRTRVWQKKKKKRKRNGEGDDHDPKSSPRFIDRLKNSNSPTIAIPPLFQSKRRESLTSFQCCRLWSKVCKVSCCCNHSMRTCYVCIRLPILSLSIANVSSLIFLLSLRSMYVCMYNSLHGYHGQKMPPWLSWPSKVYINLFVPASLQKQNPCSSSISIWLGVPCTTGDPAPVLLYIAG